MNVFACLDGVVDGWEALKFRKRACERCNPPPPSDEGRRNVELLLRSYVDCGTFCLLRVVFGDETTELTRRRVVVGPLPVKALCGLLYLELSTPWQVLTRQKRCASIFGHFSVVVKEVKHPRAASLPSLFGSSTRTDQQMIRVGRQRRRGGGFYRFHSLGVYHQNTLLLRHGLDAQKYSRTQKDSDCDEEPAKKRNRTNGQYYRRASDRNIVPPISLPASCETGEYSLGRRIAECM